MPSDPLWINAGKETPAVGTATIAASTDLFTIIAHGLVPRERVVVDTLTGGAVGVLDQGLVYYVVDVLADTFALSTQLDGPPVLFSSDGGAAVYRFAPAYSAVELRRALGGLLHKGSVTGTPNARFGARGGAFPNTNATIATVTGTTWEVINLNTAVYPGLTATSGPYIVQHPTESGSTTPADGTNDRIDALDLQIQDNDEDASGFRRARVVYAVGTPAGTPVPPALTANSLRVATILVGSGGIPDPVLTVVAPWTVAMGGVLPVRNTSELPAFLRYEGMTAYQQDINALLVWDGSAWAQIASPDQPVFAESTTDIAGFTNTSFAAGSPVVGLVFVAPPSGKVYVTVTGLFNSASNTAMANLGWELRTGGTIGSGTVILAASVDRCLATSRAVNTGAHSSLGASHRYPVLTGLTAGNTYNVQAMHRIEPAGTGNINYRSMLVEPVK